MMIYNKITLAFPEKDETLFLHKYFSDSIIQIRLGVLFGALLYAAFGYLDSLIVPDYIKTFHIIRYYIVIPTALVVLLLSFIRYFQKVWQLLVSILIITGGVGISIMTLLAPENYSYFAGLILVILSGYFLMKLRFISATIGGWIILLIFNLLTVFYPQSNILPIISYNFFFVCANLIGMLAGYNIEHYARRNYFLNCELDKEKLFIEENNNNLEKTIEQRTKELLISKEKAEESDRLKSAFLANMSHEIRTPMNGILGFTSLLQEPSLTGEKQRKYIEIIKKSGDRMLNTVNDIIDISRIESGLAELAIAEVNVLEQLNDLHSFFKLEAENNGTQLLLNSAVCEQDLRVNTDPEKLNSILTNLIKNAIKFTSQGSIEMAYSLKDINGESYVEFYVKDTGFGIQKDRQTAIFDRFVQADIEDKHANQGSGLGLAISKAYAEMLGGRMWLDSKVGVGSTFYFTIKCNSASGDKLNGKDDSDLLDDNSLNEKLKILVVEDDETSGMLLSIMLQEVSSETLHAKDGLEAVELCRDHPDLDLIFMDVKMPVLGGYEATRQIRQFNKDVIVIAQTAYGLSGDREKAIEVGCNDYITKPIKISELLLLVQKHFK